MKKRNSVLSVALILLFTGLSAQAASTQAIKIGCVGPLTGDQAQLGTDVCRGVELAVIQANQKGDVLPGYHLEVVELDDQHNQELAVTDAKKLVGDPEVVAVVGHLNSGPTKAASPIYNLAGMTQITPASTHPDLSNQGFNTFFRIAATDDVQGPKGAEFAAQKLGAKKVFVIDNQTTYGKSLGNEFESAAKKLGLTIAGHMGVSQNDQDFTPVLNKVKAASPDLIYFGGMYPEGARLLKQIRAQGITATFMGGNGIANASFIDQATPDIGNGTYATTVGGDIEQLPTATQFVQDYKNQFKGEVGRRSAYGYDAANILIQTIQKTGSKERGAILMGVRETPKFAGVTGDIIFDKKGDNQNQFIGMYKFENGQLVYIGPA